MTRQRQKIPVTHGGQPCDPSAALVQVMVRRVVFYRFVVTPVIANVKISGLQLSTVSCCDNINAGSADKLLFQQLDIGW